MVGCGSEKGVKKKIFVLVCDVRNFEKKRFKMELKNEETSEIDSGQKESSCKICGKTLKGERSMNLHFLTHVFENTFLCEVCCGVFYCS